MGTANLDEIVRKHSPRGKYQRKETLGPIIFGNQNVFSGLVHGNGSLNYLVGRRTPMGTVAPVQTVGKYASREAGQRQTMLGPFAIGMVVYFEVDKAWSKRERLLFSVGPGLT